MIDYFNDISFTAGAIVKGCIAAIDRKAELCSVEFIRSGKMYLSVNHGPGIVLNGPAVVWHHPEFHYQYGSVDTEGWHNHYINFYGSRGIQLIENGFLKLSRDCYVRISNPGPIEEIFRDITGLISMQHTRSSMQAVILLERLLIMLSDCISPPMPDMEYAVFFDNLAKKIQSDPAMNFNITDAAAAMGISAAHFRKLFFRYFNKSPHLWFMEVRMRYARELLGLTARRIKQIAYDCGYPDQMQFNKIFRKYNNGFSPRQYRMSRGNSAVTKEAMH